MQLFFQWLVNTFGYDSAMRIKNYLGDFSWFFMGFFATTWWYVWLSKRVRRDENLNEYVDYLYVQTDKDKTFFVNPKSFLDVFIELYVIMKAMLSRKPPPPFVLKSHKRRRIVIGIILSFFTLLALYGLISSWYVVLPDCKDHPELGKRCINIKVDW